MDGDFTYHRSALAMRKGSGKPKDGRSLVAAVELFLRPGVVLHQSLLSDGVDLLSRHSHPSFVSANASSRRLDQAGPMKSYLRRSVSERYLQMTL
jgi:hypothetical protein